MNKILLLITLVVFSANISWADSISRPADPPSPAIIQNQHLQNAPEMAVPLKPIKIKGAEKLFKKKKSVSPYADFLDYVSPEYTLRKKLMLIKVSNSSRKKQAFTFVFLMNKPTIEKKEKTPHRRKHLHVLWTGTKKMFKEQRMVKDKYLWDVSMAQYDDGYSPRDWNLVLPKKKPRGIDIVLMWAF